MPPVNMDQLAQDLEGQAPDADDDLEFGSPEDRGDLLTDVSAPAEEDVSRETPNPDVPDVSEEEVAEGLGKTATEEEPEAETAEGEGTETEAAAPETDEEEEEEEAEKPRLVPQARLHKEIERRKAIEAQAEADRQRLAELEQKNSQQAEEMQEEMKKLITAEHEAILNGETEKASALRLQHDELNRQMIAEQMVAVQKKAAVQTKEELAFDAAVEELSTTYPVFDPMAEEFDSDLLNDVLRDRDAFYNAGTPLADALRRAVAISVAMNGLDANPGGQQESEASKQATAVEEKKLAAKVKAAKQQPPALRGESTASHGESAVDIEAMSEEDFDALPEATLKRLRGDTL